MFPCEYKKPEQLGAESPPSIITLRIEPAPTSFKSRSRKKSRSRFLKEIFVLIKTL